MRPSAHQRGENEAEPHCPDSLSHAATSPLPCPEPWYVAPLRAVVHCRRLPLHRGLLCPCCMTRPQPWFVPVEAIATGPGSSSIPLRETVLAPPRLQRLTLRTKLKSHHLHWSRLLYRRSLRLLSPHPCDIRPGWDLGPLLQCIRDHAGGPCPPSGQDIRPG